MSGNHERRAILIALGEACGVVLIDLQINGLLMGLSDLSDVQYRTACLEATKKYGGQRKMPTSHQIRALAAVSDDLKPVIAAQKVAGALADGFGECSVVFDDPIIHAIISTRPGKWPGLAKLDPESMRYELKEIERQYKIRMLTNDYPAQVLPLWGNNSHIQIIGDVATARKICPTLTKQVTYDDTGVPYEKWIPTREEFDAMCAGAEIIEGSQIYLALAEIHARTLRTHNLVTERE